MDARPWLEQLRGELTRRKLPPLYRERLLSELSDHITDSVEDPMSTDAKDLRAVAPFRLGTPREVAATAAKEYRQGHFCRRHPVLSFLVLPVVALPLMWAVALVGFVAMIKVFDVAMGNPTAEQTQWAVPLLPFLLAAMILLPIGLTAALFCRLGRKAGVHWRWPLVACTLIAALSGPAAVDAALRGSHPRGVLHGTHYRDISPDPGSRGFLSFGLGVNRHPSLAQLAQFALPLVICGLAACRHARGQRVKYAS